MFSSYFQPILQDVIDKEPVYEAILKSGEELKNASQVQADKDNLEEKLEDITKRWNELKASSNDRDKLLDDAVEATTEYQQLKNQFVPWLDETEKSFDDINPCCDADKLKVQEEKLKVGLSGCYLDCSLLDVDLFSQTRCSIVYSLIDSFIHSCVRPFIYSFLLPFAFYFVDT